LPRPNTDVFGHCIMCGCKMIEDKMINGQMQRVFTAQRSSATYLLDSGSQMRVAMCKKDVEKLDGTELDYVMGAVKRGWQHEIETYSTWSQEKKDKYMERQRGLNIVVRSDNKEKDAVEKHLKKYKDKIEKLKPKKEKI
jgi:hypothetical protein